MICRHTTWTLILTTFALASSARAAVTLTYGAYTWTQENCPNTGSEVTSGVHSGASFNIASNDVTGTLGSFPATASGGTFSDQIGVLSVLIGDQPSGTRAVNLPYGANVNQNIDRRGLSVGWVSGTIGGGGLPLTTPVLPNGPGVDFCIFESGDSNAPEGMMVRVRVANAQGGPVFTDWFYKAPVGQLSPPSVLHAYEYDLSDMGLPATAQIDRIEIANMVTSDRIDAPGMWNGTGTPPPDQIFPLFRPGLGVFGGAAEFRGNGDYAWFQDPLFDVGTRGTLNFWVKMHDVSRRNQFFEGPGNAGFEVQYRTNSGGQFYSRTTDVGGDFVIRSGGDSNALQTWTNIQMIWDFNDLPPADGGGKLRIYRDGVESTYLSGLTPTDLTWAAAVSTVNGMMNVGRDPGDSSRFFDGLMDDIGWFNDVLTAAERDSIRTTGVSALSADTRLVAHWDLDSLSGTTEADNKNGIILTFVEGLGTPPDALWVAEGFVKPQHGGVPTSTNPGPYPGSYASFQIPFGNATYDPDPFYVATFHNLQELQAPPGTLTLVATDTCLKLGDTLTVQIDLADAPANAVGGQFFLQYNQSVLDFVSITAGPDPFDKSIYQAVNEPSGLIDFASGVDDSEPGATSGTMAVITFNLLSSACDTANLITFRPNVIPSRVTDDLGGEVPTTPVNLGPISIDLVAPEIFCPPDQTVECDESTAPANTGTATATDACTPSPTISFSDVESAGACPSAKTITRTWKAVDACGNESTCPQIITVVDTTPPVICCPPNLTVQCLDDVPAAATNLTEFMSQGGTATDNCSTPTLIHVGDGPLFGSTCAGTFIRTYRATDACNNFVDCTQAITIQDTTAPTLTCPVAAAVQCGDSVDPSQTGTATATDNCDASPAIAHTDAVSGLAILPAPAGWAFYTSNTAAGSLVSGPSTPPLGAGSFRLLTGAGNGAGLGGKANLVSSLHSGTLLSAITTLSYSTYVSPDSTAAAHLAPAFKFYVDLDGNGSRDTTLVFEPVYVPAQGPVTPGVWQSWNALNGSGWWYTANFASLTNAGAEFQPLSHYTGLFPNAKIVDWNGDPGLRIEAGQSSGGIWANFDGNVDQLVLNAAAYDFEPGNLTVRCGVIARTWTATDDCGNVATCTQPITITDNVPPVLTCPAHVNTNADAGLCTATVNPGTATAIDSCDPAPLVFGVRSDNQPLSAPYPVGLTTITWTAFDSCGNAATPCVQNITVADQNTVQVAVELQGVTSGSFTRCITFELCSGPPIQSLMTFTNGLASGVIDVPCGSHACLIARDALHTLRRTATMTPAGLNYTASFTGADALPGGNLDGNTYVDILDFGIFVSQNGQALTPNTTCATVGPHANIDGDNVVFTSDFGFIQANFLKLDEPSCCAPIIAAKQSAESGPTQSIRVADLNARGLSQLAEADLNRDGLLDQGDLIAWLQGARPGRPLPAPAPRRR